MIARLFYVLPLLMGMARQANGQLNDTQKCTLDGGPLNVLESDLSGPSQGALADGSFLLFKGNDLLDPTEPIDVVLGEQTSFTLIRQASFFQGYLARAHLDGDTPYTFFLEDQLDVGTVSFCSALGLLNASEISVGPLFPLTQATFTLFFDGSRDFLVDLDILASSSSFNNYDYYYNRFTINAIKTTNSPTLAPSLRPSQRPTPSPTTPAPTTSPSSSLRPSVPPVAMASPTVSPTREPSAGPSVAPTSAPTSSPTIKKITSEPTQSPVETKSPTAQPSSSPTPLKIMGTSAPSVAPTNSPSPAPQGGDTAVDSPTTSPTPGITASPTGAMIVETFENLQLSLEQVTFLDSGAQEAFELTTIEFYEGVYDMQSYRRHQRALQAQGVEDFTTKIVFDDQDVDGTTNTISYSQTVSYRERSVSLDPLEDVIVSPFNNDVLRADYFNMLRQSNPAFANLPSDTSAVPDRSAAVSALVNEGESKSSSGGPGLGVVVGLAALAGLLTVGVALLFVYRRRQSKDGEGPKHIALDIEEPTSRAAPPPTSSTTETRTANIVVGEDEISALWTPSLDGFSYDAEQSMSTVDYDYTKSATGNRSIVSDADGTLGGDTRQDSLSKISAERSGSGRWSKLGAQGGTQSSLSLSLEDKEVTAHAENGSSIYTVEAPPGKLGVVVDTPDDGAPVIWAVKDTSVLKGKVRVGDRLLKVDDEDVATLSAVNISRLISKKSHMPARIFTLMREVKARHH